MNLWAKMRSMSIQPTQFQKSGQTVFLMNVYLIPLKIQFNGNKSQISQKYIRSYKPGPEWHHEVVQPSQFPQNA